MDFKQIYDIQLDGRLVSIDYHTWDEIRDAVRSQDWFYVMYKDVKYKYIKDQSFFDRSTRFIFQSVPKDYKEPIKIIYID